VANSIAKVVAILQGVGGPCHRKSAMDDSRQTDSLNMRDEPRVSLEVLPWPVYFSSSSRVLLTKLLGSGYQRRFVSITF